MTRRLILAMLALLAPLRAFGDMTRPPPPTPGELCRAAIDAAERAHKIPSKLLAAIARVESGRKDPTTGKLDPWPWTINKDGQGSFFDMKDQAVAAAAALRSRVTRSLDVGCMQISLTHHPDAFGTLEQAFDPLANAEYGARYLLQLYEKTGSWPKAVALYHSATPDIGADYQLRVYAAWPEEQKLEPVPAVEHRFASPFAPSWARAPIPVVLHQPPPRVIPLGNAGMGNAGLGSPLQGRTLEAYRASPVRMAYRLP